ncbi:MAG: GNVR domain-containing protein [Pseudomonadota bacterium]
MESAEINARSLLAVVSRRRWALLLPFLFFLMLAGWLAVALPRVYRAEATLLYQPRALPKGYVQELGNSQPEDWLRSVTQRITAREKMVAVAQALGLFPGKPAAERAELMRAATSVELLEPELRKGSPYRSSRENPAVTAFRLSFEAADSAVAAKAANQLAELLVRESQLARTRQAVAAGRFLDHELQAARARLDQEDGRLRGFKREYAGGLPEQSNVNLTALTNAQMSLQNLAREKTATREKVLAQRQRITELVHGVTAIGGQAAVLSQGNPLLAQLQFKRDELGMLRSRYTGRHPDVIRAKSELASLEKKLGGASRITSSNAVDIARGNPLLKDLTEQLEAAEAEYARLVRDGDQARREILLAQQRLDLTPERAQALEKISRDYSSAQESFDGLLNKRLETRMAADLENRDAGDQFTVLDTATEPEKPFKPSRKKIFLFCTLLGLVGGMVGVALLEFADDSFRSEADAENFLKLPVLASVPVYSTSVERAAARRRRGRIAVMAVVVTAGYLCSLAAFHFSAIHLRFPA